MRSPLPLSLALSLLAPLAFADAPAKGNFKWESFAGNYGFGDCRNSPGPIWGDGSNMHYIVAYPFTDYTVNPAKVSLVFMRVNHTNNPIGLDWTFEYVNQGPQARRHPETGAVMTSLESYATTDGIYGMMSWDNPGNQGFSTLQLWMNAGVVTYEMRQKTDSDPEVRVERCTLIKMKKDDSGRDAD
ncbi:MAG: hypothetical protein HY078_11525 [Elusimicrobia bacterium]|nr:hypothetical protein [Elusimicrobiota bacterium]